MIEWEAKYKALAAGITDKSLIDNAEELVTTVVRVSAASACPFNVVFCGMLEAVGFLKQQLPIKDLSTAFTE